VPQVRVRSLDANLGAGYFEYHRAPFDPIDYPDSSYNREAQVSAQSAGAEPGVHLPLDFHLLPFRTNEKF
jgi:hypothetical protein